MKSSTLSLKTVIKELDYLRKTVVTQWNLKKKLLFLANKLIEKISDPFNAKECYQSLSERKTGNR